MAMQGQNIEISPVPTVATGARKSAPRAEAPPQAVAAPRPVPVQKSQPVSTEDMRVIVARVAEKLEQFLKDSGRDLEFRVDAATKATVITVRRADTGEIVRQFPNEEALAWLQHMNEQSGTFLDEQA